jgi:Fe-S oxidoreductase
MTEKYRIPTLKDKLKVPSVLPGIAGDLRPFSAPEKNMIPLGFPKKLEEGWQQKALGIFKKILDNNEALKVFMDICVRCGACSDKCQFFLGSGDIYNTPVGRAELLRKVYRYYFTNLKGEPFSEHLLKEWMSYFYQCSECRRCAYFCPYGIDTAEITMAARKIMHEIGLGEKYVTDSINKVLTIGNNIGLTPKALKSTINDLEEELKEDTGKDIKIPLDEVGAEVLLVPPSADFFAMPHMESLIGYAKVFYKAGISYTVSSYASEGANFAMFIGDYELTRIINKRIWDEAKRLKVKRVVIGECGHAWRAAYCYSNAMNGPFDFLDNNFQQPQHICEFTLDLINKGLIKLDKSANDDKIITYHDSCNPARATKIGNMIGGQFEIPRKLLSKVANKIVEMDAAANRERTFCCGAGAGLLADEIMQVRINGAYPKVNAINNAMKSHRVNTVAMICAICKTQFNTILPYYGLDRDMVVGVHQLISNAIVL